VWGLGWKFRKSAQSRQMSNLKLSRLSIGVLCGDVTSVIALMLLSGLGIEIAFTWYIITGLVVPCFNLKPKDPFWDLKNAMFSLVLWIPFWILSSQTSNLTSTRFFILYYLPCSLTFGRLVASRLIYLIYKYRNTF